MLNIVRFNWPMYLGSLICLIVELAVAHAFQEPIAALAALVTAYFTLASLLVSLWVYDLSGLYRWDFLPDGGFAQIANIHAGFDESSDSLRRRYSGAHFTVLDFYDPARHTEPSIARARKLYPPSTETVSCASDSLPLPDASQDLVCALFAAHEIRSHAERVQFFREVRRIARGRCVLVEHTRDLANVAAFGPGAWHFHSPAEWRSCWEEAGLGLVSEVRHTPFVRVYTLEAR